MKGGTGFQTALSIGILFACLVCAGFTALAAVLLISASQEEQAANQAEPQPVRSTPTNSTRAWWQPRPGDPWQIQLSGIPDTSFDVQVYDLDLFDTPGEVIEQVHASGRYMMCYFSAGSFEDWRGDASSFPPEVIGKDLDEWPGEKWLDVRRLDILGPIMAARLDLAVKKGCDGVDPDNVDAYANDSGFPLEAGDQLNYNRWIAQEAHRRGLAVGLKNDLAQITDLVGDFDWALNEQCFQYNECELLAPFVQAGKPVFGIEYEGDPAEFCPAANDMNYDILFKNLDLDAWRVSCREFHE